MTAINHVHTPGMPMPPATTTTGTTGLPPTLPPFTTPPLGGGTGVQQGTTGVDNLDIKGIINLFQGVLARLTALLGQLVQQTPQQLPQQTPAQHGCGGSTGGCGGGTGQTEQTGGVKGDTNKDGKVDHKDAKTDTNSDGKIDQNDKADTNNDGKVDQSDGTSGSTSTTGSTGSGSTGSGVEGTSGDADVEQVEQTSGDDTSVDQTDKGATPNASVAEAKAKVAFWNDVIADRRANRVKIKRAFDAQDRNVKRLAAALQKIEQKPGDPAIKTALRAKLAAATKKRDSLNAQLVQNQKNIDIAIQRRDSWQTKVNGASGGGNTTQQTSNGGSNTSGSRSNGSTNSGNTTQKPPTQKPPAKKTYTSGYFKAADNKWYYQNTSGKIAHDPTPPRYPKVIGVPSDWKSRL